MMKYIVLLDGERSFSNLTLYLFMENHLIINSKQQNKFLIAKYIKYLLFHLCFRLRPRQPSLPDKAPEVPDCDHLFLEKGGGGRPRDCLSTMSG